MHIISIHLGEKNSSENSPSEVVSAGSSLGENHVFDTRAFLQEALAASVDKAFARQRNCLPIICVHSKSLNIYIYIFIIYTYVHVPFNRCPEI